MVDPAGRLNPIPSDMPYSSAQATVGAGRLGWLDDIRVLAGLLIVFFHASLAYSGGNWWYVSDASRAEWLQPFFSLLRPLALGLFFLAAGYLLPGALERHGPRLYLKQRLTRLGIPLPIGLLLVFPILMYAYYVNFRGYGPIDLGSYLWRIYLGIGGHHPEGWTGPAWPDHQLGHLWFLEALLIYSAVYVAGDGLWRRWKRRAGKTEPLTTSGARPLPDLLNVAIVIVGIGHLDFLMRMHYPLYHWRAIIGVWQVHLADLPREALCFLIGTMAARRGWVEALPSRLGKPVLAAGIAAFLAVVIAELAGIPVFITGGATLHAWLYAIGETAILGLLALGLIITLRDRRSRPAPGRERLIANNYGVYLLHLPILVALQYGLRELDLPGFVKWLLAGAIVLLLSLLLSDRLRRLPGVRKVLQG
jgi:surface polysaccharide O-acyltransferase-like enzyme